MNYFSEFAILRPSRLTKITFSTELHFGNGNLVSFPDVEQRGSAQIRLKFWDICRGSLFRVTRCIF